jgi:hypothetical protein
MNQEQATEGYRYIIQGATVVDGQGPTVGAIEFFNDHGGGTYHWKAGQASLFGITSPEAAGVCRSFEEYLLAGPHPGWEPRVA